MKRPSPSLSVYAQTTEYLVWSLDYWRRSSPPGLTGSVRRQQQITIIEKELSRRGGELLEASE